MNKAGKIGVWGGGSLTLALAAATAIKWEGTYYLPYHDPVGVLTVCHGHTGPDIIPGKRYSEDECAALFEADLEIARKHVARCLPMPKLPHWNRAGGQVLRGLSRRRMDERALCEGRTPETLRPNGAG